MVSQWFLLSHQQFKHKLQLQFQLKKRRSQSAHEVGLYSSAHDETSRQLNDETSKQLHNETSSKQFHNETSKQLHNETSSKQFNNETSKQLNDETLQHFNDETMDPLVPPSNGLRKLSPDIIVTRSVWEGSIIISYLCQSNKILCI